MTNLMKVMQEINNCPIIHILCILGIQYTKKDNILALWQDGKMTDGWRVNILGNYVHDFSCKGRASGGPYAFVKKYLGLTDRETFVWFRDVFGIQGDSSSAKKKQVSPKLPVIRYCK